MSVLASKRKESKFEAITFSIDLHDMLLDYGSVMPMERTRQKTLRSIDI